jgi:hypothetical protein
MGIVSFDFSVCGPDDRALGMLIARAAKHLDRTGHRNGLRESRQDIRHQ